MVVGALGCNLAWGIIDGVFYLLGAIAERGRTLRLLRAIRRAAPETARQLLANGLPPLVASVMEPRELDALRLRLVALPEPPARTRIATEEGWGALGVALLVFVCTLPVVLPFAFFHDTALAMRVSNGVAVLMLLITGAAYGRCVGRSPWAFGALMVLLGSLLVALTLALGG
jgi:VIT1/CCC1 family predicted Fe2+/Mn2+ transporter